MLSYILLLMIGASDVILPFLSFEVYCKEEPKTNRWIFLFLLIVAILLRSFTHLHYIILTSAIFFLLMILTYGRKIDSKMMLSWLLYTTVLFCVIWILNYLFFTNSMFNYLSASDLDTTNFLMERNEFMCKMIYMLGVILILSEREYKHSFDIKYWFKMRLFLIFGMMIIFMLGLFATRARDQRQVVLYAFMAGLLFYLVYLLYLFFKDLVESIYKKEVVESQNKMNTMKLEQLLERESSYEQIKSFKHDMKNHLHIISYLLEDGKVTKAKEYLDAYLHSYTKVDHKIAVDHDIVAAILHDKMTRYPSIPIEITYQATKDLHISDADLCAILGNLLDNACEYLEHKEKGNIQVSIKQFYEKIFIEVRNDFYEESLQLETNKKDKEFHGYGLKNVQRAVKQNDGVMEVLMEEQQFIVRILMEPDQ